MHCARLIKINSGARYHNVTTNLVYGPRPQTDFKSSPLRPETHVERLRTPRQSKVGDLQDISVHEDVLRL